MHQDENRREFVRYDLSLPLRVDGQEGPVFAELENISAGGVALKCAQQELHVGSEVQVHVDLPGQVKTSRLDAVVRWSSAGRAGLQFRRGAMAAVAAFVASLAATPAMAADSGVPEFDPNAEQVIDPRSGGERPDEAQLLDAFQHQFDAFDACVAQAKRTRDEHLPGDVDVAVLLDPGGKSPLGVNATLPERVHHRKPLKECLRSAVASAAYPAYDGPPVVVEFSFELDPGLEDG